MIPNVTHFTQRATAACYYSRPATAHGLSPRENLMMGSRGWLQRREFVTLLGGAAALPMLWPLAARAQQAALPVVGFLRSTSPFESLIVALRQGLKEAGFIEGQNVAIEYRHADNQVDRLPALVADLISRPVGVIVGDNISAIAAKAATTTVPIVFASAGDPVRTGLVASLNRPGGNITGVSFLGGVLGAKRLELLRQIVPKATTIAVLMNPDTPTAEAERRDVQEAAQTFGLQLIILNATSNHDLETAFAAIVERGADALLVGAGALLNARREWIVALAARHALPAIYLQREFVTAGGLMSYGASISDGYRQAGFYAGRILKGEKPEDLPVMQSTKFELVLNLKTAKSLRREIPPMLLALADEVIE
jgi:putative tryptophan/tyrosine transport system substrate-binding protein